MARHRTRREEADASKLRFAQPDRSGPNPNTATLLDIAEKRGLLNDLNQNSQSNSGIDGSDQQGSHLAESVLWSVSLAMLHFTFDVLVQHQYAVNIEWPKTCTRSLQAFAVFLLLVYSLHPSSGSTSPALNFPPAYAKLLHQSLFFAGSLAAGCYLIYITNEHTYYAVMKRAPALGCLWIWSVIELDLKPALGSLLCSISYLLWNGYSYK